MRDDREVIRHDLGAERPGIRIYPIADLHIGSRDVDEQRWHRWKQKLLADPNAYIVIAGDMMNNAIKSSVSDCYAEVMRPSEQKKWLVTQLSDIRERILCGVPGNHEARSQCEVDDDPLYDVFAKLDLEDIYRPVAAFLWIKVGYNTKEGPNTRLGYRLQVTHGTGGGALTGGAVNRTERALRYVEGLDVYISAHCHKALATRPSVMTFDVAGGRGRCRILDRDILNVVASPWQSYAGYAMAKQLSPSSMAVNHIWLDGREKHASATI